MTAATPPLPVHPERGIRKMRGAGFTPTQTARAFGVSRRAVGKIEREVR